MPIFKYKALNSSGKTIEDFIEASNYQLAQKKTQGSKLLCH